MNKQALAALAIVTLAMVGGCDKAQPPDKVASEVASAQSTAAANVADAQKDAMNKSTTDQKKVDDATQTLQSTDAKGAYDVAISKADGDKKVMLEQCNALAGDAQRACKDQADARHDLAVANAKAAIAGATGK